VAKKRLNSFKPSPLYYGIFELFVGINFNSIFILNNKVCACFAVSALSWRAPGLPVSTGEPAP